jgi:uncharacterized protein
MIGFVVVILSILGLIHWFLYSRLISALAITSPGTLWPLRILALFLAVSYILARVSERYTPESVSRALDWVASIWVGLMWELLWLTLFFFVAKLVLIGTGFWGRFDATTLTDIGKYSAISVISAAVLLCGWGMIQARRPARITEVTVPVKNITPEMRKLRIVQASDFHSGILLRKPEISRMTERIMSVHPDLILLPGDIVDQSSNGVMLIADAFRNLKAPLGVFGSTGNHEYYVGIKTSLEFCEAGGIRMLMNEKVELPGGLVIAGIEDRTAKQMGRVRPTIEQLVDGTAREKPMILMNHSPFADEAQAASDAGVDLMISGHTHGGQIWPFGLFSKMAFKYNRGLFNLGQGHLFTSTGIGTWGPPMRIGAPPEIVLIRLVGKDEPEGMRVED